MGKFESSQKCESRAQSADSSKISATVELAIVVFAYTFMSDSNSISPELLAL